MSSIESSLKGIEELKSRQLQLEPNTAKFQGVSFAGFNLAADQISGDGLVIMQSSRDSIIRLACFDVAGHGLETAIDWGMARAVFSIMIVMGYSPKDVIYSADFYLAEMTGDQSVHTTALFAQIDLKNMMITYVLSAHEKPLIFRRGAGQIVSDADKEQSNSGRALNTGTATIPPDGMSEENNYFQREIPIIPGDVIFFYTDGLTEGRNRDDSPLGKEGLVNIINQVLVSPEGPFDAKDIVEKLKTEFNVFFQEAQPEDDQSLWVIVVDNANMGQPSHL